MYILYNLNRVQVHSGGGYVVNFSMFQTQEVTLIL
jgi:hypothetical protein